MTQDPDKLFADITRFIAENERLMKEGNLTQLKGLDDQVARLCAEALELTGEQCAQYADKLQHIVASLHRLQQTMMEEKEEIAKQLSGLPTHKKAHVAYQKTESSDKKNGNK